MKSHQPRYAIRKYAVGVASVLVGFFASGQVVAADTPSVTESPATTLPTQPSDCLLYTSDHGNVQSFPHGYKAAKKAGIQLIYGMEANIVEDRVPITYNEVDLDLHEAT